MNRLALILLKNIFRLPGLYSRLCHYAKHTDRYPEDEKYDHIRKILKHGLDAANVELTVTGLENVPMEGGCLLLGNHQGMFDVVALGATTPRSLAIVFKKELANMPLIKQIAACTNSFAMDREDVRQSLTVIQNVTEQVKQGRAYVIFPEGTRSKTGNAMKPFHAGTFRAAIKAKCPVVPLAFIDCYQVLDQKGSKPLKSQLHYLPPVLPQEYEGMKAAELAQLVQSRIEECIRTNTPA